MQMPIPQNGARGSCRTDTLQASSAIIIAAATLVPSATQIARPLIAIKKFPFIRPDSFHMTPVRPRIAPGAGAISFNVRAKFVEDPLNPI
jgi:hypothetical protein